MKSIVIPIFILLYVIGQPQFVNAVIPINKIEKIAEIPYNPEVSLVNLQKMHIEDDKIIVCSNMGLYSIDLNNPSKAVPYGFNGIPVSDYIRKNSIILTRTGNIMTNHKLDYSIPFAYISEDNGKTFKEFIPNLMENDYRDNCWSIIFDFAQNPINDNELLILNNSGLWKSNDFGKQWKNLSIYSVGNLVSSSVEYSPFDTNIFMYHGEDMMYQDALYITKDGGNSWFYHNGIFPGDNCIHQMAFHPTDPNIWVYGGEGCIGMTINGGETFDIIWDVWSDNDNGAYFYNILFDNNEPNVIFAYGEKNSEIDGNIVRLVTSFDLGKSWHKVVDIPVNIVNDENKPFDMVQTTNYLYLMTTDSKIYRIKKSDIKSPAMVEDIHKDNGKIHVTNNSIYSNILMSDIKIYSVKGSLIMNESDTNNIDISLLAKGIYIMEFVINEKVSSMKFVKE